MNRLGFLKKVGAFMAGGAVALSCSKNIVGTEGEVSQNTRRRVLLDWYKTVKRKKKEAGITDTPKLNHVSLKKGTQTPPWYITEDCVGCDACVWVCDENAISEGDPYSTSLSCYACEFLEDPPCRAVCPVDAIKPTP